MSELEKLLLAARSGDLQTLRVAAVCRMDLSVRGRHGTTLLHEAAIYGHVEACRFLVDQGLEVDIRDFNGGTPLSDASSNLQHAAMRLLISLGANPDARNHYGTACLHYVFLRGDIEGAKILLWAGANPNQVDANGMRPEQLMRDSVPPSLKLLMRACAGRAALRRRQGHLAGARAPRGA